MRKILQESSLLSNNKERKQNNYSTKRKQHEIFPFQVDVREK